jgi:hypothetical protein
VQAVGRAQVEIADSGIVTGQAAGFMTHGAYFQGAGYRYFDIANRQITSGTYTGATGPSVPPPGRGVLAPRY